MDGVRRQGTPLQAGARQPLAADEREETEARSRGQFSWVRSRAIRQQAVSADQDRGRRLSSRARRPARDGPGLKRTPPASPNERCDGRPIGARRGRVEDGLWRDGKARAQYTGTDE